MLPFFFFPVESICRRYRECFHKGALVIEMEGKKYKHPRLLKRRVVMQIIEVMDIMVVHFQRALAVLTIQC